MNHRSILVILAIFVASSSGVRQAQAAPGPLPDVAADAKVVEARKQFVAGNDLAKASQWAQALAAFERSAELRPHALTTFNMAVCERALGRFTRARVLFVQTIAAAEHDALEFPTSRLEEARGYLKSIEDELVRLEVHLEPASASLGADGRALVVEGSGTTAVATAGLGAPGAIEAAPAGTFALLVDPGTHFFRVVAKGYADVSLTKTYAPGTRAPLDLQLSRLPATVKVSSNVADPIVTVDGSDVGFAPVAVSRPAGTYRFVVKKSGFDTFDTRLAVLPGQEVDLSAKMAEEKIPLTKRWWFWTGIAATLAGAAVITYAAPRPDPYRLRIAAEPPAGSRPLGDCKRTRKCATLRSSGRPVAMHDVLPLALVFSPEGLKCTVHCPSCAADVLADATTHRATCGCGAILRVVIANVLHGARIGSKG